MATELTPEIVRQRALAARVPLIRVLDRAGVAKSTFWRWENDKTSEPWDLTVAHISDALEAIEAEKAS